LSTVVRLGSRDLAIGDRGLLSVIVYGNASTIWWFWQLASANYDWCP